jgi:signal-induced proliferation-associated 1 like protein 3
VVPVVVVVPVVALVPVVPLVALVLTLVVPLVALVPVVPLVALVPVVPPVVPFVPVVPEPFVVLPVPFVPLPELLPPGWVQAPRMLQVSAPGQVAQAAPPFPQSAGRLPGWQTPAESQQPLQLSGAQVLPQPAQKNAASASAPNANRFM